MNKMKRCAPWLLAAYIAFVFVQSLFFKFSAAQESVYIFQTIEDWLGLGFFEPGMRLVIGALELVAAILLFTPGFQIFGALLSLGVISGAIFFHLFSPLGIEVQGDGGTLFYMAVGVWGFAMVLVFIYKEQILKYFKR